MIEIQIEETGLTARLTRTSGRLLRSGFQAKDATGTVLICGGAVIPVTGPWQGLKAGWHAGKALKTGFMGKLSMACRGIEAGSSALHSIQQ